MSTPTDDECLISAIDDTTTHQDNTTSDGNVTSLDKTQTGSEDIKAAVVAPVAAPAVAGVHTPCRFVVEPIALLVGLTWYPLNLCVTLYLYDIFQQQVAM